MHSAFTMNSERGCIGVRDVEIKNYEFAIHNCKDIFSSSFFLLLLLIYLFLLGATHLVAAAAASVKMHTCIKDEVSSFVVLSFQLI